MEGEEQVAPFEHVARIWAPNAVIKNARGPFVKYAKFAALPRAMRAAPDATTWAGVQLWRHWSDPQSVANDRHRHSSTSRRELVWTVMISAARYAKSKEMIIAQELLMLILSFIYCE